MDKRNKIITYSGANNGPFIINNNVAQVLPKDRMPVGIGEKKDPFNLYRIDINPGDTIYLYTDGFADQFGGDAGKKFKTKALNEFLYKISGLPLAIQKDNLKETFEHWKGNLEQVDDVLIIGIRM
jgi:serine phosphatase RsbU (regulator of sigma subunit)